MFIRILQNNKNIDKSNTFATPPVPKARLGGPCRFPEKENRKLWERGRCDKINL